MSFLRKASLTRKHHDNDSKDGSPVRGPSVRHNKPPTSRSVSNASVITDTTVGDGEQHEGAPKKKGFPG
jgi:hypothetical protein